MVLKLAADAHTALGDHAGGDRKANSAAGMGMRLRPNRWAQNDKEDPPSGAVKGEP